MKGRGYKALLWGSMLLWFTGLIVMLVGIYRDEAEIADGFIILLVGMGMFCVGIILTCVFSVLDRRNKRKQVEKQKAELPPNVILLGDGYTAHFTEEGVRVLPDDTFGEFAPAIPYAETIVYHVRINPAPRSKGKDCVLFGLPVGDALQEIPMGGVHGNRKFFVVGEEILPFAQTHGVEIVDKRQPRPEKVTPKKKFVYRKAGQVKNAIAWTVISVAVFAGILGLSVLFATRNEGASSGISGGVAAAFVTPCVLNAVRLWQGNILQIYEEGVFFYANVGHAAATRTFLFWEEIERIGEDITGIYFDCGCGRTNFPAVEGVVDYLKELHPEKFEEKI